MTVGMVSVSKGYKPMKKKWNFELMEIYTNMKQTWKKHTHMWKIQTHGNICEGMNTWKCIWKVRTCGNVTRKVQKHGKIQEKYEHMEMARDSTNTKMYMWKYEHGNVCES